jgi:hypothetical protein
MNIADLVTQVHGEEEEEEQQQQQPHTGLGQTPSDAADCNANAREMKAHLILCAFVPSAFDCRVPAVQNVSGSQPAPSLALHACRWISPSCAHRACLPLAVRSIVTHRSSKQMA